MDMVYPVVITKNLEDNMYYAGIPDFTFYPNGEVNNEVTYGDTFEEACQNVKEVLILELSDYIDEKKKFPKASKKENILLKKNQTLVFLCINLEFEIAKVKKEYKNKTVTLPIWLDILAQEKKINFSQTLQKALKKELHID